MVLTWGKKNVISGVTFDVGKSTVELPGDSPAMVDCQRLFDRLSMIFLCFLMFLDVS
jgi:hypothetical protein